METIRLGKRPGALTPGLWMLFVFTRQQARQLGVDFSVGGEDLVRQVGGSPGKVGDRAAVKFG